MASGVPHSLCFQSSQQDRGYVWAADQTLLGEQKVPHGHKPHFVGDVSLDLMS